MDNFSKISLNNNYPYKIIFLYEDNLLGFDIQNLTEFSENRIENSIAKDIIQEPELLMKTVIANDPNGFEICLLKFDDDFHSQIIGETYLNFSHYMVPQCVIINDEQLKTYMQSQKNILNYY